MQSQYVVVPIILVVLLGLALSIEVGSKRKHFFLALIAMAFGLSSLIMAAALGLAVITVLLIRPIRARVGHFELVTFGVVLLVSAAFQALAPGTFGRLADVAQPGVQNTGIAIRLLGAVVHGLMNAPLWLLVSIGNLGVVISVLVGIAIGYLGTPSLKIKNLFLVAAGFFIFGVYLLVSEKFLKRLRTLLCGT